MALSFITCGFVVGMLIGLTGVGGGSLMTPLLTLLFGFPPSVAVGTDLAFASITKISGTFVNRFNGSINWLIVRRLSFGALPAALVATLALKNFGVVSPEMSKVIRYSIAISVSLTALMLLFKTRLQAWLVRHPEHHLEGPTLTVTTVAAGVLLGTLVTISSIGAGAVGASLLVLMYPRLSTNEIVGTDIAYAVPLTAIAAFGHWWLGSINWLLLGTLLLGSIPGITIGSFTARVIPEKFLRGVLVTMLTGVAIKLTY